MGVSGTTALQWVTGGAYLALFVACVWAGRRASLRAAAVAFNVQFVATFGAANDKTLAELWEVEPAL